MDSYQHHWRDDASIGLPVGKVVCVGRNYADHAKELNNPVPAEPLLFIKPATAVVTMAPEFSIPGNRGEVHHETEIALLIGAPLSKASEQDCVAAIAGIGLGLDLTLRDLQGTLKSKGQPWEKAKAFDGSCPLSAFVPVADCPPLDQLAICLAVNGNIRQQGSSAQMLFPIPRLLAEISQYFTLLPGDVVLTGTPAGVAALHAGDELSLQLNELLSVECRVAG